MFAGAQKLIDGWWPVVVGLWARALVGKGRGRSEGETGERHKSRTNRCGTMNNVIILRHVDQLRLCKLKRVSHRKGNACVVYLILVASVVVRNDARRNQSCASTSYPMLANYTPVILTYRLQRKQYQITRHGRIAADYSSGSHQACMGAYRTSAAC